MDNDLIEHWRGRAEKAEADLAAAQADIVELLDWVEDLGGDSSAWKAAARGEQPSVDFRAAGKAAAAWIDERPEVLGQIPLKSDVCPTCDGNGDISMGNGMYPDCHDCGGTGKKETK
jgi:hypothetical protein